MAADTTDQLVALLGRARLDGQKLADSGGLLESGDLASEDGEVGYDIQTRLAVWHTLHGQGNLAGYKIGATAKGMQEALNVAGPVYGHILSGNVLQPLDSFACNPACEPGIECEIAFRLGTDLVSSSTAYTRDDVATCIDAVMPAMEIVENRYGDYRACSIAMLTADDFFHKACVLGNPVHEWRAIDLAETVGRTSINGKIVQTGQGREVLGHPLEAVVWLANKLAKRKTELKAGQIIMTGSMTPVHWIESLPSECAIDITGLGDSSIRLTERS